jgi:hypothetical protein
MIGTGSFSPSGQFNFPRSYVRGIGIQIVSGTIAQTDNTFVLVNPPDPTFYTLVFSDRFWNWSSNRYTLDWIIEESYYNPGGLGTQVPMPYLLTFYTDTTTPNPYIIFSPFSSPGGVTYYELPPPPPGYWLPFP